MSCFEDRYGYTRSYVYREIYGWNYSYDTDEYSDDDSEEKQKHRMEQEKKRIEQEKERMDKEEKAKVDSQISCLVEMALKKPEGKNQKNRKKKNITEKFSLDEI